MKYSSFALNLLALLPHKQSYGRISTQPNGSAPPGSRRNQSPSPGSEQGVGAPTTVSPPQPSELQNQSDHEDHQEQPVEAPTTFPPVVGPADGQDPSGHGVDENPNYYDNQEKRNNWWEFGMADAVLDEVALYYLGQSWYGATDVAETLETMYRVDSSDPWSWFREFTKTAERLEGIAEDCLNAGHGLSAGQTYLRVATYRRASLHRHPDPFHSEVPVVTQLAVESFVKFLELTEYPCKPVRIPYEDTTLPGYLCLNPQVEGPAPAIIFNEGKDGWAEDGKSYVDQALLRGYHTLLWDGPGMGQTIRLQSLPFRHDWENVLTPVIDYLAQMPEVDEDNIALVSLSLGGYLGPRAAVYEHRLKALVANTGVLSWGKIYEDFVAQIDPNLLALLDADPEAFDNTLYQIMDANDFLQWGFVDSMWHHNTSTPVEMMRELQRFTIEDKTHLITTPTLIIDAEFEERGQPKELYAALKCDKKYIYFTKEEAAPFHVQAGATALLMAKTFNWLDDQLDHGTPAPEVSETSDGSLKYSPLSLALFLLTVVPVAMIP